MDTHNMMKSGDQTDQIKIPVKYSLFVGQLWISNQYSLKESC